MVPFFLALVRLARLVRSLAAQGESRALLVLAGLTLAIGAWFYHRVEGWGWIDSLYFCVITLTTIGYGDLAPRTDLGKLFTMMYVLIGVGLLVGLIDVVAQQAIRVARPTGAAPGTAGPAPSRPDRSDPAAGAASREAGAPPHDR